MRDSRDEICVGVGDAASSQASCDTASEKAITKKKRVKWNALP